MRTAAIVVAGVATVAAAQQPSTFRSSVVVVTVTATVTDRGGRFVTGLGKDDFAIFEDGRRRDVSVFADESAPVSLGILLDASGSMIGGKLRRARDVISRLVTSHLDGRVEWFFARFSGAVVLTQEWTRDREAIRQPLRETRATGDTSLYDAVALTIPLVMDGHFQKKALLLVSDGGESKSLVTLADVQKAIGLSDVRVYGIGVDADDSRPDERLRMKTMRRVAEDTGGATEEATDDAGATRAASRVAEDLRHLYLLGYATDAGSDGRPHTLRVEARRPGLKVRARRGFY